MATLLLGNGMDIRHIQHLLGHSTIVTTQIYAHVDDTSHRRMLRKMHPRRFIVTASDPLITPPNTAPEARGEVMPQASANAG